MEPEVEAMVGLDSISVCCLGELEETPFVMGQCVKVKPLACALSSQPEPIVPTWPGPEAAGFWGINIIPQLVGSNKRNHLTHDL